MEDYKELRIEADTFDKLRRDADIVLQRALGTMKEKESMDGIRRYRAYAFHHKKKRIRKKYMKKLLEASPIDRFAFLIRNGGVTLEAMTKNVSNWMKITGEEYMPKKDLLHGTTGSHKSDHPDSKIEGGVR